MKSTSHKTWQTSLSFLELLQIQILKRKSGETWHIIPLPLEKVGGTSPVSPTKLRPCPQGSVLAPLLFIFISDLRNTVSRKYAYADDPAIMHAEGDWQAVEGMLTKDMATVSEYLQTWELKLSTTKTVSAAFHLNNKEAKRELKVKPEPKYLGVTLDRSLTYR